MGVIEKIVNHVRGQARGKRARIFAENYSVTSETRVIDIGSEDGSAISRVLAGTSVKPQNVFIADINEAFVKAGQAQYGFTPVVIPESGTLPFPDQFFDIVYCSSVIEHVTIPKAEVWAVRSAQEFKEKALERQTVFAREIRRLGKAYFVQTPNRWFPVESHTWLPFVGYLPRQVLIPLLRFTNSVWIKRTTPDWYLLTTRDMRKYFPDAVIKRERFFGLTKSLMAIKILR